MGASRVFSSFRDLFLATTFLFHFSLFSTESTERHKFNAGNLKNFVETLFEKSKEQIRKEGYKVEVGQESSVPLNTLKDYYERSKERSEELSIAFRDNRISYAEERIARAERKALFVDFNAGARVASSHGQERFTMNAGLGAFKPLFDKTRRFAHEKAQLGNQKAAFQQEAQRQLFIYEFLEAFLLLSERKSRFYFDREEVEFLVLFYEKVEQEKYQQALEQFLEENEGNPEITEEDFVFDAKIYDSLQNLDQNIRARARSVRNLLRSFYVQVNKIERLFLEEKLTMLYLVHPYDHKNLTQGMGLEDLEKMLLENNLSLKAQSIGLDMERKDLKIAQRAGRPRLGFHGQLGVDSSSDLRTRSRDEGASVSAGITLSMPWLDGGQRKNRAKIAEDRVANEVDRLKQSRDFLLTEFFDLYTRLMEQNLQVEELIREYADSRLRLDFFLGRRVLQDGAAVLLHDPPELSPELVEQMEVVRPLGVFAKQQIVLNHFRLAEELVSQQHGYLRTYLQLKLAMGKLNAGDVNFISDTRSRIIVDCRDFAAFIGIEEDFFKRRKENE